MLLINFKSALYMIKVENKISSYHQNLSYLIITQYNHYVDQEIVTDVSLMKISDRIKKQYVNQLCQIS